MYKMKYLSAWVVLVAALYGCADDLNYSETHVPSLEVHYIACDAPTNLFLQSHEDNCEMAVQSIRYGRLAVGVSEEWRQRPGRETVSRTESLG